MAQKTVTEIPANPLLGDLRKRKRKLRVAAYCRVSTEEEEQQNSFEVQVAYYTDKIMAGKVRYREFRVWPAFEKLYRTAFDKMLHRRWVEGILKEDGLTYEQAFSDADYRPVVEQWSIEHLGYIIKPENLFRELVRKIVRPKDDADRFSVEDYERAVNELTGSTMGQASEAAFSGLFNDMKLQDPDLGDTVAERTALIAKVIVKISEIDFSLSDSQFDVLGTAYMILIGLFASDAGKKSGEFFTPTGPSKLVATLATVGLDEAKTVGDCTCGSASMLLEVQKHLTTGRVGHFYGQENNATTYNLARMNMLMHGVDYQNFDIYKGDTLREDKYGDV